ncbi:hypothetical protein [Desulfoplanes formicivorans]|uniref:Polysaccharide biosynthesis protein n=1 Tax=Desulfoplanes formicivorans TaxID=1592317 RepID=A0A194AIK4_9BACT|nr:hypothetical protein [Desulfoplanes formicivorans]GAU09917.1 hypothetical protein DPF_2653 [Desulfoplanes formicivorans]
MPKNDTLTLPLIFRFWLPLALVWLMMGVEQPAIAAVIARLPGIKENLAAFGLTFALSLIIEAPIIQLLSAANVLAKDRQSYNRLLAFTHLAGWSLSLVHLLVAITPLFDGIVCGIIHAPKEIVETTRSAFLIMTPWTVAIAYRRLWQGILIGYGHTSIIPLTMTSRLVAIAITLGVGSVFPVLPGACLGAMALSLGVITGAVVTWFFARNVVAREIPTSTDQVLTWRRLLGFYVPLALTSMIALAVQPIMSIGLARMDHPLESLAIWPVLTGFMALFQTPCFSYQEAVVALLPRKGGYPKLQQFTWILGLTLTLCFFSAALSQPLRWLWFGWVSGLSDHLLSFVRSPLLILAMVPLLTVTIAWFRGILVSNRHTTTVTYAVMVSASVLVGSMLTLPLFLNLPGVVVVACCIVLSLSAEAGFLQFCVARGRVKQSLP